MGVGRSLPFPPCACVCVCVAREGGGVYVSAGHHGKDGSSSMLLYVHRDHKDY